MSEHAVNLLVKKDDLRTRRAAEAAVPPLQDGEALLRVDAFALTANTVTYAAIGEQLGYWRFFPSAESGFGRVPCWGFGDVIASKAEGVAEGARFYGYYPIGSHLVVSPARVRADAFTDGAPHRQGLPPVYNNYIRAEAGDADAGAMTLLFRPLFTTSWLIDDYLAEHDFFGAKRVLLSSASSKTALGLAYCLKQRGGVEIIGLTSADNADFVRGTGVYDRVLPYAEIGAVAADAPIVYVDFGGSNAVRTAVHRQFGTQLKHDCAVGATDWTAGGSYDLTLPGPAPAFFFAPTQVEKRTQDWGGAAFNQKLAAASGDFFAAARPWMRIVRDGGPAALERFWGEAVDGKIAPADGVILRA